MRFISSAENGSVGVDLCFGALTLTAGFRSIHRACSQNRKNARIRSRFFVAYTAPSSHVVLNSRIAPTSICFSSRRPFDSHQPMNRFSRRFFVLANCLTSEVPRVRVLDEFRDRLSYSRHLKLDDADFAGRFPTRTIGDGGRLPALP